MKRFERAERIAAALRKELDPEGTPDAEDLRRICRSRGIILAEPGMYPELDPVAPTVPVNGFALRYKGQTVIFVRSFFDGSKFNAATAFHELGHVLLDHLDGGSSFDLFATDTAKEDEADRFSEIMLS